MTIEEQMKAMLAASIRDFNERLSNAKTIEERARLLRIPAWIVAEQEAQEAAITAEWAAIDAREDDDQTDNMDWEDMRGLGD